MNKLISLAGLVSAVAVVGCVADTEPEEITEDLTQPATHAYCVAPTSEPQRAYDQCWNDCESAYNVAVNGPDGKSPIEKPYRDTLATIKTALAGYSADVAAANKAMEQCRSSYESKGANCETFQQEQRAAYLKASGRPANYFDDPTVKGFDPFDAEQLEACQSSEVEEAERLEEVCISKLDPVKYPSLPLGTLIGEWLTLNGKKLVANGSKFVCENVSCSRTYWTEYYACRGTCIDDVDMGTACTPGGSIPDYVDCGKWKSSWSSDSCSCSSNTMACTSYRVESLKPWSKMGSACPVTITNADATGNKTKQTVTGSMVWIVGKNAANEPTATGAQLACRQVNWVTNEDGEVEMTLRGE